MSDCRFVYPERKRLELSRGDWVEVKKRLGIGEQKKVENGGLRRVQGEKGNVEVLLDFDEYSFIRAEVYILEWSLRNRDDKPVEVSASAIRNLEPASFEEIDLAIKNHIEENEAEKKQTAGLSRQSENSV